MNLLKRLATDERGVTAIEYGLIAAGIGVAILTGGCQKECVSRFL
jgi:Flp pilus assembly pilin Flp